MAEETGPLSNERDWYLQLFASLAEKKVQVSVTLNVGGMLITGLLISITEYFEGTANLVSHFFAETGVDSEEVKSVEETLRLQPSVAEEMEQDPLISPPNTREYLHLKDVQFYSPDMKNVSAYPPGLL